MQSFPEVEKFETEEATSQVESLQEAIRLVRGVRSQLGIAPEKKIHVVIRTDADYKNKEIFVKEKSLMAAFMGAGELAIDLDESIDISKAFPAAGLGFEAFVFVREAIDVEAEIAKLEKEIAKATADLEKTNKKLSNEQFVANAAPAAVEKEKAKKAEFEDRIQKSTEHIALLKTL